METAKIMLEHNMVHVLASDGHGVHRRGMNLPKAYAVVEKLIGTVVPRACSRESRTDSSR